MRRRDLLTYDIDPRSARSGTGGPNRRLLALLVIVLAMATVLVVWTVRSPARSSSSAPVSAPAPVVAAPSSASTTPTPTPLGSDASTTQQAPDGSRAAAVRFIAAWLERSPTARKDALKDTAAPGLAEQLIMTSDDNIPRAGPTGSPVLEDASTYGVQFVQRLSSGMTVRVYLVSDPQSRYGWVATSVEKV